MINTPGAILSHPFVAFTRHWNLTKQLAKSEVLGRYRGANIGLLWSLLSPLMMLAVYSVAFGTLMKAKWPEAQSAGIPFAVILFAGLAVSNFFSDCFNRAPRLMVDNANYVKKLVFPMEILPWSAVVAALFHLIMNLIILVLMVAVVSHKFYGTLIFLPIIILPLIVVTAAFVVLFSSIGPYIRDIALITPVVSTAMFFLSSALMPLNSVPQNFLPIFKYNPLTFIIDQVRAVILFGDQPDWVGFSIYSICALVFLWISLVWFRYVSKGFSDVL